MIRSDVCINMLLNIGIFWYEVLNKKFILNIVYIIYENI